MVDLRRDRIRTGRFSIHRLEAYATLDALFTDWKPMSIVAWKVFGNFKRR